MERRFVCDREGDCEEGERLSPTVRQRRVTKRKGHDAKEVCEEEAKRFFYEENNVGQSQVEITVVDADD